MPVRDTSINHSFLIRIYQAEKSSAWYGWVQHTRSGEIYVFDKLDRLLEFIQQHTGKLETPEISGLR